MKVLISDAISDSCLNVFSKYPQIEVLYRPELGKSIDELKKALIDVDALAVRSTTQVTREILDAAPKLKIVGRAGIGVDNIDVEAASEKGVLVMNTPNGNRITTAEHTIALMCSLVRSIPQATASLREGKWEKSKFMGVELFQKTLGLVGCGNIGKIVAKLALGLDMKVVAFDPFLSFELAKEWGIQKVELTDLYKQANVISVHTPLTEQTRHLVNKEAFLKMKPGVFIINCARGGIVSETDLLWAIDQNIVAGAALDVFETEPVGKDHPLLQSNRVIFTPHLGASTEEAQENVAVDVAEQISKYLLDGSVSYAVNSPSASKETLEVMQPYILVAKKLGEFFGQLCKEAPQSIDIRYQGEASVVQTHWLTRLVLEGALSSMSSERAVNTVNALYWAKELGITVSESKSNARSDFSNLIEVDVKVNNETYSCAATVFGHKSPRFVRYNGNPIELNPQGTWLVIDNKDKPGVLGRVGTYLGAEGINISHLQLGLNEASGLATAFYLLNQKVDLKVIQKLEAMEDILKVHTVYFS